MIAKCFCKHCEGKIEFDASGLVEENSIVPCPHCGKDTKLFVDENFYTEPTPAFEDDKTKPLKERIAAFKAHVEATRGQREADLREIEEHLHRAPRKITSGSDELEIAGDTVIIRRRGLANALAMGLNGERAISISSLTAIQFKPGTWLTPGYILFSYAGSKPFMGGLMEASQDPDAFVFNKDLNEQVSAFKAKVEQLMHDSKRPATSPNTPGTLTEELRRLADLKQQGILSEQEFQAAKKKLLS